MANKRQLKVHFMPDDVELGVAEGDNLLRAAQAAGVQLSSVCGGQGTCGRCRVLVKLGTVESRRSDKISEQDYEQGEAYPRRVWHAATTGLNRLRLGRFLPA